MPESYSVIFGNQSRQVEKGGRNYLVAPGVPVREQVMNTYLLPAEEIEKYLSSWNGTPLSIWHPKQNGGSVNVPEPDVAIIGNFYNAEWDQKNKRMLGEYWIDIDRALASPDGQTIIDAIKNGKMLETSTAYWADEDFTPGTFDGRPYKTVHKNPRRDHIAIFPDQIAGACSLEDGCGVNRNMKHNCGCGIYNQMVQNVTGSLPASGKAIWEEVYEKNKKKLGEERAAKIAWGAVKKAGWSQDKDDKWVHKNNQDLPQYQKGHLPRIMLEGYAFNKGSRMMEGLEQMKGIIEKKGITKPVWIQQKKDGSILILDGAHRVSMAHEFNIDQIPVRTFNELFDEIDPEVVYTKWHHDQDRGYLKQQAKGNWGHKGRPGQIGGSSPSGASSSEILTTDKDTIEDSTLDDFDKEIRAAISERGSVMHVPEASDSYRRFDEISMDLDIEIEEATAQRDGKRLARLRKYKRWADNQKSSLIKEFGQLVAE